VRPRPVCTSSQISRPPRECSSSRAAPRKLDRFDQQRRDVTALDLPLQRVEVAERHDRIRQQRVEPLAELLGAVDGQCAGGEPVVGVRAVDDARLPRRAARELQCRFDGFRPAVAEVDALHPGCARDQLLGDETRQHRQVELQHVGEVGVEHVVKRLPHHRMVAANTGDPEPGQEVEVAVSLGVPVVRALGADERPVEADRVQHPRHLAVDELRMQTRAVVLVLLEQRPDVEAHPTSSFCRSMEQTAALLR
jgi:hypothetical protein